MSSADWLASPQPKALLWAALVLSLGLGVAVVAVDRQGSEAGEHRAVPLTDDQAAEQVVGSARQIVAVGRLQDATGGYTFVSCENEDEPPYQAMFYMSFRLPHGDWTPYLDEVASAMIVDGWVDAPTRAERFGRKFTSDGVTAVLQHNGDDTGFATMRLYGECRNTGDHHNDSPAWTEVSL